MDKRRQKPHRTFAVFYIQKYALIFKLRQLIECFLTIIIGIDGNTKHQLRQSQHIARYK